MMTFAFFFIVLPGLAILDVQAWILRYWWFCSPPLQISKIPTSILKSPVPPTIVLPIRLWNELPAEAVSASTVDTRYKIFYFQIMGPITS
jgi:hypothetical protein